MDQELKIEPLNATQAKAMNSEVRNPSTPNSELSDSELKNFELASSSVSLATAEQAAQKMTNPWVLLKVKALGELVPEAALALEKMIDEGRMPHETSYFLFQNYRVRLSELEVGRYGGWLPRLRRDAIRKRHEVSDELVQQAKQRMKRRRRRQ